MQIQVGQHEGTERYAYRDSRGYLTIGKGRCIDERGKNPLSDKAIDFLLNEQIDVVEKDLDRWLSWWRNLDQIRQRVLADMCYNMGIYTLRQFDHTLRFIQAGNYAEAAKAMVLSDWYKETGRRAIRLVKMMELGIEVEY